MPTTDSDRQRDEDRRVSSSRASRGYTYSPLYDELKAELEAELGDAPKADERLKQREEAAKGRKRPLTDTERTAQLKEDTEDQERAALQKAFDDIRPPPSFDPPMDQVGAFRNKLEAYRTARAVRPVPPARPAVDLPNETADERARRLAAEQQDPNRNPRERS